MKKMKKRKENINLHENTKETELCQRSRMYFDADKKIR